MTKRGQDGGGKGEKWDVCVTLLMRSAHLLFIFFFGGGGVFSWRKSFSDDSPHIR